MPIREYICESCGNKVERIEKMNCDWSPPKCILCFDKEMVRIPISSGTSFILKGGGWAAEGYSKKRG